MSIIAEAPNYLQVFSDGTVKRFSQELIVASSTDGLYMAKDVVIDPSKPITGRLFLPTEALTSKQGQLPVVVYFHGGGFCIGSTTWLGYHVFLGGLSTEARAIILSVDYRLAPENRLPTAYFDCYCALEWLTNPIDADPWIELADLSRVFLSGDSAGGNIAHNVAIQSIKKNDCPVKISGLLLIHPYFGSEKRTAQEIAHEQADDVMMNDMFWRLSIPEGSNRDYFGCNYEMAEISTDEWSKFPRVVVFVAGLDFLMERGVMYARFIEKNSKEEVKLIEAKAEKHPSKAMGEIRDNDAYEEELLDYEEEEEKAPGSFTAKVNGEAGKKGYVGIHSSGFRDFLLKPELLRAIVDSGFEHPSEGKSSSHLRRYSANGDNYVVLCL
ncbi:hypothetical protein Nepgr_008857 [Nepenthes gracilis]|uniref:Alpha/beta hydrolase fold-3 domain-containing protein n=1 Tax=Nepenthes gracilis TaxID=150966 RepID=A0AAD3XJM3_NEPGR|nr:hypothetical protein Nepgr_008857 [Nepenthes gracilis]